jgi:nitroreductase
MPTGEDSLINEEVIMDYSNFLELVKNRRSIRRFKPDPVPDEDIEKIIEAARWAPSGYNSQPWEFVVVKDKGLKDRILKPIDLHKNLIASVEAAGIEQNIRQMARPWLNEEADFRIAPVLIILFSDPRTRVALPDMGKRHTDKTRLLFNSGLSCAFIYMQLAATSLGLATQWLGAMPKHAELIKQILGVPEEFEFYEMMPLGYPGYKARPKLLRPKYKMVHFDGFNHSDIRTEAEVNDFARRTWTWTTANHRRGLDKQIVA